jgi:hypothetical protein
VSAGPLVICGGTGLIMAAVSMSEGGAVQLTSTGSGSVMPATWAWNVRVMLASWVRCTTPAAAAAVNDAGVPKGTVVTVSGVSAVSGPVDAVSVS